MKTFGAVLDQSLLSGHPGKTGMGGKFAAQGMPLCCELVGEITIGSTRVSVIESPPALMLLLDKMSEFDDLSSIVILTYEEREQRYDQVVYTGQGDPPPENGSPPPRVGKQSRPRGQEVSDPGRRARKKCTTLNGSHGECTETDDLATRTLSNTDATNAFQARRRAMQEAQTIKRVVDGKHKPVYGAPGNSPGSTDPNNPESGEVDPWERPPPSATEKLALIKKECFIMVYENAHGVYPHPFTTGLSPVLIGGSLHPFPTTELLQEHGWHCYSCGPGWVALHPDDRYNTMIWKPTPLVSTIDILGYSYRHKDLPDEVHVRPYTAVILDTVYASMSKMFPAARYDEALSNATMAYCVKEAPSEFVKLATGTAEAYCHGVRYRAIMKTTRDHGSTYASNGGLISREDPELVNNISKCLKSYRLDGPLQILDVEAPVEMADGFTVRADVKFTCREGQEPLPTRVQMDTNDEPCLVPHHRPGEKPITTYRTSYGSLSGDVSKTQYAPSNNVNMSAALRRVLMSKKEVKETETSPSAAGENELRCNALRLAERIAAVQRHAILGTKTHVGEREFVDNLEASVVCNRILSDHKTTYGEDSRVHLRPDGANVETRKCVDDFIAECMHKVIEGNSRTRVQKFLDCFHTGARWSYNKGFELFLTTLHPYLSREACSLIPHLKRELRRAYVKGVLLHLDDDVMVRKLDAVVKREIAKAGKVPRFVAAYGAGCMYANELPEMVKVCLNGSHTFVTPSEWGLFNEPITLMIDVFAKPKAGVLPEMFRKLDEARSINNHVYVMLFSDDSCYSGCVDGESFLFNADISGNDASQDAPAFYCTIASIGKFHRVRAMGLLKQCMLPIEVRDKECPRIGMSASFKIKVEGPFEGSGSVLTTVLNHQASMMIAMGFTGMLATRRHGTRRREVLSCLTEGAALVGHTMTMDRCERMEDVLFLKRYPVGVRGHWSPAIAAGSLLRNFGCVDGDLTHLMVGMTQPVFRDASHEQRFRRYQSGIMAGWRKEPANALLQALRARFPTEAGDSFEILHDSVTHVFAGFKPAESVHMDSLQFDYGLMDSEVAELACALGTPDTLNADAQESFARRYQLSSQDVAELTESIATWEVGCFFSTNAARMILAKDYGM